MIFLTAAVASVGWSIGIEAYREAQGGFQDTVVVVGDSTVNRMNVHAITPAAENYGVSGSRVQQTCARAQQFGSAKTARAWVVKVGVNDTAAAVYDGAKIRTSYQCIADRVAIPLVFVELPPPSRPGYDQTPLETVQARVTEVNGFMREVCAARPACAVVASPFVNDDGSQATEYFVDGTHENPAGYARLVPYIREALVGLGVQP